MVIWCHCLHITEGPLSQRCTVQKSGDCWSPTVSYLHCWLIHPCFPAWTALEHPLMLPGPTGRPSGWTPAGFIQFLIKMLVSILMLKKEGNFFKCQRTWKRKWGDCQNVRIGRSHKAGTVAVAQSYNWTLCCDAPRGADDHMVQAGPRGEESDWTGCACSGRSSKQRQTLPQRKLHPPQCRRRPGSTLHGALLCITAETQASLLWPGSLMKWVM